MTKIAFYAHGGSKNHGCEAIVRTTADLLSDYDKFLFSSSIAEDELFRLDLILPIYQIGVPDFHQEFRGRAYFLRKILPAFIAEYLIYLKKNVSKQNIYIENMTDINKELKTLLSSNAEIFFSIGGDNYCYDSYSKLEYFNKSLNDANKLTVLWGCSIEPEKIEKDLKLREDLQLYSLITARESLTYNALINNNISKNTFLIPDPAFCLEKTIPDNLPKNFIKGNTVGINISPMVQNLQYGNNLIYKNIINLINYILKETDMNIAFIPHVTWGNNNDYDILKKLYKKFKYSKRVCLIGDSLNCKEIKGIISECRFLVASRTHASIAGYSSEVPTLVLGYSVKANGIAKDIFGDYKKYVLPVQNMKEKDEILNGFKYLIHNETKIKEHYRFFMPQYIQKVLLSKEAVTKMISNKNDFKIAVTHNDK